MRSPKNFYLVRWAKPEDYKQLLDLSATEASIIYGTDRQMALEEYLRIYGPEPYMTREGIKKSISDYRKHRAKDYIIVVEKYPERRIVGFVHARVYRNTAYLNDIVIDLSESKRGLGSLLVHALEDAIAETHPEVRKIVTDAHPGSRKFFERYGYEVVDEEVGRDGIIWYRMEKKIGD
ncbi:MAG: Acetyltransferase domain [Candidatus Diapherotrites archaeon]|nr:Acetyltransferase domain [Candidatus Diapherotrites archaeon]MDN5366902.1 Acetyltransferase domain [Candidatus Diapherotrites archaeon]